MKKIEFALKNFLLKILLFFNSVYPPKADEKNKDKINLTKDSKILFIRLNKIGDALVTTPLLKLIKDKTGCSITILADKKNHFIFNDSKIYDEVLIHKKGLNGFKEIVSKINAKQFDVVIDLHDDISTTVSFLIASIKAPVKIALKKGNENIYTHLVEKINPVKSHVVLRVMEFAKAFNLEFDEQNINIHYFLSENSINGTKNFLKNNFTNKFLAGVNISAGSVARFWGVERFKKVITVLENYDLEILILSTETEKKFAEEIAGNKYPIFTTPDFNNFAAMISKLDFLFTPDTSIVHLASAFEIPMFGIYVKYKTTNMIWSPFKSKFDCVITEEPNFKNLEFEQVEEKFKTFIEQIYEQRNSKV